MLGLGLAAMAWRRARQRQRRLRVVAGVVATCALWFAAFPPLRQLPAARAEAILLTDDFQADSLRALQRSLGNGTPVWYYGPGTPPAKARALPSLLSLAEQRPGLRKLHVLGRGLAASELSALGNLPVVLHSRPTLTGISTAFWSQKLALGEVFRVEGTVAPAPGKEPNWVRLRAAGTVRDSVRVPAGGGAFRLRYQPKTAGLAVYELQVGQAGKAFGTEPMPVEITTPALPAVLLLTGTPSFEFKYLKNYLAEAHYPVALRTTVSRGLVQTDFVNQPAMSLNRLTPALLARYAIVGADAATLAALTGAEAQALQAAVSNGRLGLLVLADAAPLPRPTPARARFTVLPRAAAQTVPQLLAWPDAPVAARAAMPAQLRPESTVRPLVAGPGQAMVAGSSRMGLGFVVVSVVPETFRWGLQGRSAVYASFWNRLLSAAVPPPPPAPTWRTASRWPRAQQPLVLHLSAAFPEAVPTVAPLAGGPNVRLALRQDSRLPEWSTAQFWPATAGWYRVRGPGAAVHCFYVFPAATWHSPELQERQQALASRTKLTTAAAEAGTTVEQPWPAAWFFGLFLLAAGYLWLEEKL
ncbi:MAG TPA: hypothetical protein VF629_24220 [Hymenobacter sp.]|uniref:hypothetical protein n=1 Tax=Hymenobacter sp. TaxID=1898978 RepID=UPI002ED90F58